MRLRLVGGTKVYGTSNNTLVTKKLKTNSSVKCDGLECKKSDSLANSLDFDLLSGDGHDGEVKHGSNATITISSDKEYAKIDLGSSSTLTIEGDIILKIEKDFKLGSDSALNIKGNVTIYTDVFHLNSNASIDIDGSLKVLAKNFKLNTGSNVNIPNPQDFVVLTQKMVDINSLGKVKGLFYSEDKVEINSGNEVTGAITGKNIDISSDAIITYDADAVKSHCGIIEETTTASNFNLWDIDESIDNQVIKTKIVGENINLTFAALDKTGSALEETTAKDIKVALFNTTEQLTIWHDVDIKKNKHTDVITIKPDSFTSLEHQNEAFKTVKVFIKYEDSNGTTQISTSSDSFAIRPNKFTLSVPPLKKAAETFTINAATVSLTDVPANSYNEQIESSFNISYKENIPTCDVADINFSGAGFVNGSLSQNIKYAEVGELNFNISEIAGSEFAIIDKDDTSDARRYITEANSSTIELQSAGFEVTQWTLDGGSNRFKYYADMSYIDQMGAQLDVTVKAINLDGNITKNYRDGCYIKNTNFTLLFDMNGTSGEINKLEWKDILHSGHDSNTTPAIEVVNPSLDNSFNYDLISSSFVNGVSNESFSINFGRDQTKTKDPIRFTLKDIKVYNSDSANGNLPQSDQYVDFYYGRLHAPTYYGSKNVENVKIFHEVYCKNCDKTNFIYAKGEESADNISWYIMEKSYYEDGVSRFDGVRGANNDFGYVAKDNALDQESIVSVGSLSATTNTVDLITFQIPKLPFNDRIIYSPSNWLIYNRFNETTDTHSFNINISSTTKSWAGKGEKGLSIKEDASVRSYKKMDW